jgi:hypothetical protein
VRRWELPAAAIVWEATAMTREQLEIIRQKVKRSEEILADIDALQQAKAASLEGFSEAATESSDVPSIRLTDTLLAQVLVVGINTLLGQREADLDAINVVEPPIAKQAEPTWRDNLTVGWRREADAITKGEYWLRWTSPDGLYYWLHPVDNCWVTEPEQVMMPTFGTSEQAWEAARHCPSPPEGNPHV